MGSGDEGYCSDLCEDVDQPGPIVDPTDNPINSATELATVAPAITPEDDPVDFRASASEQLSPAAPWAVPLTQFVDVKRAGKKQCRKLRFLSMCCGLHSEGMVADVPALVNEPSQLVFLQPSV
jgi:hypothetical protein